MTIYLNTKQYGETETIDEFTQGSDNAPSNYREFRKYVNEMAYNYRMSGQNVYKSQRCTNEWKQR